MIDEIIAFLPISFAELSPEHQQYLSTLLLPQSESSGFTPEQWSFFGQYRLQCDQVAIDAIEEFNTDSRMKLKPDANGLLSVELLTDCGDGGNYSALRSLLFSLKIVAFESPVE